jgi:RHS repeat-associated protein
LKKLFSSFNTLNVIPKLILKQNPYWVSSVTLLFSGLLLLNLSFGQTNGIENNLQPMPSVSVDLNGKSNVSYQIDVPEGTKGVDPDLSIHYNSSGGFGNMGVGWNFSGIHWITRDATYGIDYTTNDQFTSTLGGALVKAADGNYYSRKETFIKFVPGSAYGSGQNVAPATWTAYDKSGTTYTFTALNFQGVLPSGDTPIVWALTNVSDIYGNGYSISYSGSGININYADRSININYANKTNQVSSYSEYSPVPSNKLISNINIAAGSNLTRSYTFTYGQDTNNRDLLTKVDKSETYNGTTINYAPINYAYATNSSLGFSSVGEFSNPETFATSRVPLDDKMACVNGVKYCYLAGQACSYPVPAKQAACLNTKATNTTLCNGYTATWGDPCTTGFKTPSPVLTVGDMIGNGSSQIIQLDGDESSGSIHLEATKYTNGSFIKSRVSNNLPGFKYQTFYTLGFGDVNGDGRVDFAYSDGSVLKVAFSNGNTFNDPVSYGNVNVSYGAVNYLLDRPDTLWKGGLVDLNGDGRADYVKVVDNNNLGIHLWNGSNFNNMITVNVGTSYMNLEGEGPEPGQFIDLNGDQRPEWVFVANGKITARYFSSNFATSNKVDYPISNIENSRNRWISDINSDGKPDFITLDAFGNMTISLFDGVKFNTQPSFAIAESFYATKAQPSNKLFVDLNGDGFVDYIRYAPFTNAIKVSYGNGRNFSNGDTSGTNGFSLTSKSLWNIGDFNGDGLPDIISLKEVQGNYFSGLKQGLESVSNFLKQTNYQVSSTQSGILEILSFLANSNTNPESKVEVFLQNYRLKGSVITQVDAGFNRTISLSYDDARNFLNSILTNGVYPSLPNFGIGTLVKSVTTNLSGAMINTDTYSYSDNRIWMGTPDQVASLGFRTRTITSSLSGETHFERYIQSSNTLAGMSDYNETKNAIGQYRQITNTTYTTSYPLGREWTSANSTSQTAYRDGVALITTTENYAYDSYGNVTTKTTSAAGSVVTESDSYTYDTTNWILNRPSQSTKDIDGAVVENTQYVYSGNTGVTVTSMAGTVAAATSNITLDGFGNQQSVTDPLGRTTSYQYDSVVHNYVTKITNPANFTITKTYDTSLGLELTAQDANGAVMTKRYDTKGRLSEIIPPGADSYVERYSYVDYAVGGAYFKSVTKAIVNPDGGETLAEEYFDMLGRSVRKESPGVGNNIIVETTEYDAKGQVSRKSNPYLENVETPVYTVYTYNPYEGYVTRVDHPDSSYTLMSYNGFNESTQTYASDATLIQSQDLTKNAKGQVLTRTVDGMSMNYQYDTAGRQTKILDPEGSATTTVYDNAGRKTSVTDANSGTTSYTYDQVGNIKTQKDARNITTTFTYDNLNRPTSVSYSNGEGNTVLTYDEGGKAKYALGRLTTVVDDAGKLELGYDIKGNRIYQKRKIDDLEIIFRREYDIQSRLASTTYPDGTKVYQKYATTGHFSGITMDTADGSSKGYTVGSYNGPVIENGQFKIIRETGNGVKMEIEYDPIKRRPKGLVTKLASGHIENAVAYTYDQKNNIIKIADTIVNGRTQDFVYDAQNRLIKATGKYGIENYTYSDGGNLLSRSLSGAGTSTGSVSVSTYTYADNNHKHAVTSVTSPSTGTFNYSYDEAGNMISRNGDTMSYNSQGKLKQIDTEGGDKLTYLYDSTGNRIKKTSKTSGVVVYNFDGLYEIARTPGEGDKHTLYFKGLFGDIFSQMTRNDAALITDASSGSKSSDSVDVAKSPDLFELVKSAVVFPFAKGDTFPPNSFVKGFFCEDVAGSCSEFYTNSIKYYWIKGVVEGYTVVSRVEFRVGLWIMLIVMLYLLARILSKLSLSRNTGINEEKSKNSLFPLRLSASVATISILFTFTQCGIIGGGKKKGDAPWLLLASGVNSNTPSVDSPSNGNSSGGSGGSGGSALVPVVGMYFLHPDHLGSITMITDGRGNVIAGGNNGGKSHISYKPYGEIHRTDSSGPDITRFKYTGQEEDKESGLLYYKARYYDPMIGRFLQADSVVMPQSTFGMNRYMYVEGNPVRWSDRSGNKLSTSQSWMLMGYLAAPQRGMKPEEGLAWGAVAGRRATINQKGSAYQRSDFGKINAGKAWDSIIGKDGIFGWLGNAVAWKRVTKFWDYNVKDKEMDYMRETIGGLIVEKVCSESPGSERCKIVSAARGLDRNMQAHKYHSKRDVNFGYFYNGDGSGLRVECVVDNSGKKSCTIVPEEISDTNLQLVYSQSGAKL